MISKEILQLHVRNGLSSYAIADELGVSASTVRRWLKKHELRTNTQSRMVLNYCMVCSKSTKRRKLCAGCYTKVRRFRMKSAAVGLLGGKCSRCGWKGNIAGFEFHHLYGKDFTIGNVANKSWSVILPELKKCELLCSTCHRIEHSDNEDELFRQAVETYKGRPLDT